MISDGIIEVADGRRAGRAATWSDGARGADLRDLFGLAAVVGTFGGIAGQFAISAILLESRGIVYLSSGGGILAKFHPATLVAILALGLRCLASRRPIHAAWRLATSDVGVVLLTASVLVAGFFAVVVDKTPVSPLVDTFVLPIVVFLLLRDLDPTLSRWLATIVAALLVINALVAVGEFLRGTHMIKLAVPEGVSADPTRGDTNFSWQAELALDWRATALLGHPLVNGLIVGGFIVCLVAPGAAWIPWQVRLPLLGLESISMFAFGARTSLVLTIVLGGWFVLVQGAEAIGRGVRVTPRAMALAILTAGILVVAGLLLWYSGFLDKTLDRFTKDSGSAGTRLTMFSLLAMPLSDLVFKPDQDVVATMQRIYGLEFGIESSWLGLVLTYGLVVTGIVVVGLVAFCRSVLQASGRGAFAVLTLYMILISVTASISGKTTSLGMVVILVLLFLRKEAPIGSARSVSGGGVHGPA